MVLDLIYQDEDLDELILSTVELMVGGRARRVETSQIPARDTSTTNLQGGQDSKPIPYKLYTLRMFQCQGISFLYNNNTDCTVYKVINQKLSNKKKWSLQGQNDKKSETVLSQIFVTVSSPDTEIAAN